MAALKFAVGIAIGSLALISDALHSLVDFFATVVTWIVVRFSDRPADTEHHYGHGKIESLSALGVIALLYVLAGGIVVEAVSRLRERRRAVVDLGPPLHRAAGRHGGQFLARPRPAEDRARNQEPGARGRRAAFRVRRLRLGRGHHRARAQRLGLQMGRRRGRDRHRRADLACSACGSAARPSRR